MSPLFFREVRSQRLPESSFLAHGKNPGCVARANFRHIRHRQTVCGCSGCMSAVPLAAAPAQPDRRLSSRRPKALGLPGSHHHHHKSNLRSTRPLPYLHPRYHTESKRPFTNSAADTGLHSWPGPTVLSGCAPTCTSTRQSPSAPPPDCCSRCCQLPDHSCPNLATAAHPRLCRFIWRLHPPPIPTAST